MSKPVYIAWRDGYRSKIDPEVAYKEIERLRVSYGGSLTAEIVAEEARKKRNPLHPEIYDKNESDAAWEYYKRRARECMRAVIVRFHEDQTQPTRAFVPILPAVEEDEVIPQNEWRSMEEVLQDPDARQQLLNRVKAELKAFRNKYKNLQELVRIWEVIDYL